MTRFHCMIVAVPLLLVLSVPHVRAETHRIIPKSYPRTFSSLHEPILKIRPGDRIVTQTLDSGGQDYKNERRAEPANPLNGPFYVEGAEPGDALAVRIDRLRMNRNWAWSFYRLGLFALAPSSIEGLYPNQFKADLVRKGRADLVVWDVDLEKQTVRLREPVSSRIKLEFPARPMLGCIGTAPPGAQAITSIISGSYGGNMDYNEIGEGVTVYLPVYHPGGLLMVGDGHALQGDGEPTGSGVETTMDLEMTVNLLKKHPITGPRVENDSDIISVGSQPEFITAMDHAAKLATSDMVAWLTRDYGLEPWAAHLLVGYAARYDVVTLQGSVALRIPKKFLPPRP